MPELCMNLKGKLSDSDIRCRTVLVKKGVCNISLMVYEGLGLDLGAFT